MVAPDLSQRAKTNLIAKCMPALRQSHRRIVGKRAHKTVASGPQSPAARRWWLRTPFSQSARDALGTTEPADSRAWLPEVPNPSVLLVRAGRLELPRPYGQQILS